MAVVFKEDGVRFHRKMTQVGGEGWWKTSKTNNILVLIDCNKSVFSI
jgi:hypothetical protein